MNLTGQDNLTPTARRVELRLPPYPGSLLEGGTWASAICYIKPCSKQMRGFDYEGVMMKQEQKIFLLVFLHSIKGRGKWMFKSHSLFGKMKQITDHFSVTWKENQKVLEVMAYFYVCKT